MSCRSIAVFAAASIFLAQPASATDLVDAWHAAQEHDLEFSAARSSHEAGAARRAQGSALWRPSVSLTGTAGRMSSSSDTTGAHFSAPGFGQTNGVAFNTSVSDGNTGRWAVTARQPLFSPERHAQSRQLELAGDVADWQWQEAQQALMLRTVQGYFDVGLAEETLRVLREQQRAVQRALAEAQERFRLGDIPVTATHEATARAEAIKAQVLAAETDLQLKQIALADVTGLAPQTLQPRLPGEDCAYTDVAALNHWLDAAAVSNPGLRMQSANVAVARQEAARYRATASASLDLVAEVGRDELSGSGDFGPASNVSSSKMIGVQLTVPVFTGGYRSARHDEARSLAEKAGADEARTRQQIALQTRSAWLGLTVGASRVAALSASLQASRARLDATRLAHTVGDRTTLDLLNAESDASSAELNLLQARIGVVTERLRLAALAGELDDALLQAVDARLQAGNDHTNP